MRNLIVNTSLGQVTFAYRGWAAGPAPKAVVFHGFGRRVDDMLHLQEALPYELIFARLPSHYSPALEPELGLWISAFREAIALFAEQPVLCIGESLGGLVAMAMGLPSVALEPFLDTSNLWPLEIAVATGRERGAPISETLLAGLFNGTQHHRILPLVTAPTLVVGGSEPLLPRREVDSVSLLSEADAQAFAAHPLVEVNRIAGGHLLLVENPAAAEAAILSHGRRHAPWPSAGPLSVPQSRESR